MSNAPLILSDNLFENTILHPAYAIGNSGGDDVAGREVTRIADNLRDLTSWTPSTANATRYLYCDAGAAVVPNLVIVDRGHNLAGATVQVVGFTSTALTTGTTMFTSVVPTTPGGLPTDANGCLTPDGVWWKTFTGLSYRVPTFAIAAMGAGVAPIVTGLYLGTAYRFPVYLNTPFADDYRAVVANTGAKVSRGGVRVLPRRVNYRKLRLSLDLEATDYAAFDAQVRPLLRYGQPWWVCLDDSDATLAGLMAPFQIGGDVTYEPSANPVHREVRALELEEVIPRLWV